MKSKIKIELLGRRYFVFGLLILLLNDFVLKYLFHNDLTGKLSDFAGLFIFAYFFAVFFERYNKMVYLLTGLGFIFWKSPFSTSFIQFWNSTMFFSIHRVIDYTDLIALSILPFSYLYFNNATINKSKLRFAFSCLIGFVSILGFCATSQPREEHKISIKANKPYIVSCSKKELFQKLSYGYGYSDTLSLNLIDTMFYLYIDIPEKWSSVTMVANIKEADLNKTVVVIDSIISFTTHGRFLFGIDENKVEHLQKLSAEGFLKYFETYYLNPLMDNGKAPRGRLYFDNKELIDKYIKK